ncbi:hypothetical protein RhiirA1_394774 [Rhizophagus irregularis]|uniref:Uncharacterized protein n=1 Tax=Rhizophagus irregularis TaxID=588596 RepID=A0A2N0RS04_9GLOM|nr:hypothetical protein RhiirA1_394774 [Rhizophagus irregularis]
MSKNSQSSPPVAGELIGAEQSGSNNRFIEEPPFLTPKQVKKFLSFLTKEEMAVYETLTDEQKTFYLNVLKRAQAEVKKTGGCLDNHKKIDKLEKRSQVSDDRLSITDELKNWGISREEWNSTNERNKLEERVKEFSLPDKEFTERLPSRVEDQDINKIVKKIGGCLDNHKKINKLEKRNQVSDDRLSITDEQLKNWGISREEWNSTNERNKLEERVKEFSLPDKEFTERLPSRVEDQDTNKIGYAAKVIRETLGCTINLIQNKYPCEKKITLSDVDP